MFRGTLLQRFTSPFLHALAFSALVACEAGGGGAAGSGDLGEVGPVYDAPAVEDSALVSKTALLSYANAQGRTKSFGDAIEVQPTLLNTTPGAITSCEIKAGTRALPAWLSIDNESCVVSGTAIASLTSTTYTIRVTNEVGSTTDANLTLSVTPKVPIIAYNASETIRYGESFSIQPVTKEVRGANITNCLISSGTTALPKWITLNKQSCALTGTPPAAMAATEFSIIAKNYAGYSSAATVTITSVPNTPVLGYVGAKKTAGTFGVAMAVAPTSYQSRGATVSSCGVKDGTTALPSWASVNTDCVISGTPDAVLSSTTYTLVATNSAGDSNDATVTLSVAVGKPTLSYTGATTTGTLGQALSIVPPIRSGNGASIKSCVIKDGSRALPTWASINNTTCEISGTPTSVSSGSAYTVRITNNDDLFADASVSIAILADYPVLAYSSSVPAGKVGSQMIITPTTLDAKGDAIRSCALKAGSPALPAGFSASAIARTTCVITGTPTELLSPTTYTLVATNKRGVSNDATVTLSVGADRPVLSFYRARGTSGTVGGSSMTIEPTTKNPRGAAIEDCRIKDGTTALPTWATIDPTTCIISGTPDAMSTGSYQIEAENSAGVSDVATVSISVAAGLPTLSYANATNPDVAVGGLLGGTSQGIVPELDLKGAPRLVSCTIRPKGSTAVPSWLVISSTTCALTGTARTALDHAEYYVRARNTVGYSTDTLVTLNVEQVNTIAVSANNNQSGTVGQALASPFTAIVRDGLNAVVQNAIVDWVVLSGDGTLSSASNSTNSSGLSSSTLTLGTASGTQTVKATLRGTTISVTFTATAVPGALDNFLWSGVPTSTTAGSNFNATVTARDSYNNVKTDYIGTVQFSSTDSGSPTLPANYTYLVGDGGVKQFTFALKTAGNRTITVAESDGSPTATTSAIAVDPGDASYLVFSAQASSSVAGQALSAMQVQARDAYGNTATGFTGDVVIAFNTPSGNPGNSTLSGTTTQTAVAGVATFSDISLDKVGTDYRFKATSSGLTQGLSVPFDIGPGALDRFEFTNVPTSVSVDAAFNMTITGYDAYGNIKEDLDGTVSFSSSDSGATLPGDYTFVPLDVASKEFSFTFDTPGAQSITATLGAVASTSADISVNDYISISVASSVMQASGSVSYTISGGSGSYTVSIDNSGHITNGSGSGDYFPDGNSGITTTILVSDNTYGQSATATVDVYPDLSVAFDTSQVEAYSSVNYTISGGSNSYTATINFGSLSNSGGSGTYSPDGSSGTATLSVTDALGFTGSASVDSYYNPPPNVEISVANTEIFSNGSTTYSVINGTGSYSVTVSSGSISNSSGSGTFSPDGNTGTITIYVYDNGNGSSSSVDVTVVPPFEIGVDNTSIYASGSTPYHIYGGSGNYSVSSSFGSVDNSTGDGNFYPGGSSGTATISVYDNNTSNSASVQVTVSDDPPPAFSVSVDSSSIGSGGSTAYYIANGSGNYSVSVNFGYVDNAGGSGTFYPNGSYGTATISVYDNSWGQTATVDVSVSNDNMYGGCTDSNALNYDSGASWDDGSCSYAVSISAGNGSIGYNSSTTYSISGGSGSYSVSVTYGSIDNSSGGGTYYPNGNIGTATISVYDNSWGHTASVNVDTYDDSGGGSYGGCTNGSALNYDSGASWDDGSCYYAVSISVDNSNIGYYGSAAYTISGGSGSFSISVSTGSIDNSSGSGNYSPNGYIGSASISVYDNSWGQSASVNVDSYDDSGGGGGSVGGCTDSNATNYNSSATYDDGSCEYPISISIDNNNIGYNSSASYTVSGGSGNYSISVDMGYIDNGSSNGNYYPNGNIGTATITVYDNSWGQSASVNVDSYDDSGGGGGGVSNIELTITSTAIALGASTTYTTTADCGVSSVTASNGVIDNSSGSGTFIANGTVGAAQMSLYDGCGQNVSVQIDVFAVPSFGFGDLPQVEYASVAEISNVFYLFGGAIGGAESNDLYSYDTSTTHWKKLDALGDKPVARQRHAAAAIGGKMYVFGGGGSGVNDILYEYDSQIGNDGAWRSLNPAGSWPSLTSGSTLSAVGGKLYLIGGYHTVSGYLSEVYEYDPSTGDDGTWTFISSPGGDSFPARSGHSATVIDSDIYVFGGQGNSGYLNDFFVFHTSSTSWESKASSGTLPNARSHHGAQYTGSMLLILGGSNGGGTISEPAIYDVTNDSWNSSPTLDGLAPQPMSSPLIFGILHNPSLLFGVDNQSSNPMIFQVGASASSMNFGLRGNQYSSINSDGGGFDYYMKGGTGSYYVEADSGSLSNSMASGAFSPSSAAVTNFSFSDSGLGTSSTAVITLRNLEIVASNSKTWSASSVNYQVRGGSGSYSVSVDNGSIDNSSGSGTLTMSSTGSYVLTVTDNLTSQTASFTVTNY